MELLGRTELMVHRALLDQVVHQEFLVRQVEMESLVEMVHPALLVHPVEMAQLAQQVHPVHHQVVVELSR
jgi:hypothetical protein